MPTTVLERVAKITDKGQVTVPKPIREALGVDYGGHVAYRVDEDGSVTLGRVEDEADPAIDAFLCFLAKDMQKRPEVIEALSPALVSRIAELVEGVGVDLEEEIKGSVAL